MPFMASSISLPKRLSGLACLFVCLLLAFPAMADDDPFDFDTSHWMSFDRYKENTKHGTALKQDDQAASETPVSDNKPADAPPAPTPDNSSTPVAATAPTLSPPTRPLNLPVMPGINKGFSVQVNSTEDDTKSTAHISDLDTQPSLQIPENNWQSAAEAARHSQDDSESVADSEHSPLDVRMSFLPNQQITPTPSPQTPSNHGRAPMNVATGAAKKSAPAKTPTELAACAAVDAYKKKQLEAIESDKQTLQALQAAIAQLGLQKQLDFMPGTNGTVSAQTSDASSASNSAVK